MNYIIGIMEFRTILCHKEAFYKLSKRMLVRVLLKDSEKVDMKLQRVMPTAIDLCLILTFAQCVPDDYEQIIKRWKLECVEETKVDADLVLMLKTGNWRVKNLPLQKWALCMLVRAGIMSQEGVFKLDEALANVPKKKRYNTSLAIDECLYKTRHLPHEIAWHYLKCYNADNPSEFRLL